MNIFKKSLNRNKNSYLTLIDVDGTISPCQYEIGDEKSYYSSWNGSHYFPTQLKEDILSLPNSDFYWLTSWKDEAEKVFKMGWNYINLDDDEIYDYKIWKFEALEKFLSQSKNKYLKIVWFDDESYLWKDEAIQYGKENNISFFVPEINNYSGLSSEILFEAKEFLLK